MIDERVADDWSQAFDEGYASASIVIKRFVKTLIKQEETEIKEYRPHCDEEYYCIKSRIDALKLVLAFIDAPDDEDLQ